jgi:hypothetical protein
MTICLGEQGVIFAETNIHASVKFGAALTNNNAACWDQLTTEGFNTKTFRF